jgi:hypothetical protein
LREFGSGETRTFRALLAKGVQAIILDVVTRRKFAPTTTTSAGLSVSTKSIFAKVIHLRASTSCHSISIPLSGSISFTAYLPDPHTGGWIMAP